MSGKQRWSIRPGLPADRDILERMIYEALYWQPDAVRETFDFVIAHPEISRYVADWGRPGDSAVVAESLDGRQQVGAAWYRLFSADLPGYGFVSPEVPEVAIAVEQGFRGLGIGRALMEALIERAQSDRQPGLSLSVELANVAALGLYQRLGFVPVGGDEHNHTMLLSLDGQER